MGRDWRMPSDASARLWQEELEGLKSWSVYLDLFLTFARAGVWAPGALGARFFLLFAEGGSEFRPPARQGPRPAVRGPRTHDAEQGGNPNL